MKLQDSGNSLMTGGCLPTTDQNNRIERFSQGGVHAPEHMFQRDSLRLKDGSVVALADTTAAASG